MSLLVPIMLTCIAPVRGQEPTSASERRRAWEQHQRMESESPFRDLAWRAVGPKFQGGRIEAIALPPSRPGTIYLGVGSGGVFKTTDDGVTWRALFDRESTTSIGSIAIAPSAPDTVWVGTGETHSGTAFPGSGIFKSTDGGATWKNTGLHDSQHIARVIVDPEDANIVYAGVLGHHRSSNAERGVFKTDDGGASWRRVFFAGDSVGVIDLVMDPYDASTFYAATWDRRGPGSGVHKSTDAGETWRPLTRGMPSGEDTGRIGLDVSRSRRGVVYVLLVNKLLARGRSSGGAEIYRSDDAGETFARTHEEPLPTYVGWDFCDVRIAADDENRIYVCGQRLLISADGGGTFTRAGEKIERLQAHLGTALHLDMHEVVVDPADPGRVLLGTDGGLFISNDRAQSWLHLNNLPIGEFYTVALDMATPYRIWGGTQDNASLYGPSAHEVDSTSPDPWKHVFLDRWAGGDGFVTLPDPTDANTVYYEHQNGDMRRKQLDGPILSGRGDRSIKPRRPSGEPPLRFAWNTPLIISHHNPRTLYCAAQQVFKSEDRGDHWTAVGSELGSRAILSLSESPLKRGLLYAGSDAGQVHMTGDDGVSWNQISDGLPRKKVTRVVASRHTEGVAYVTLTGAGQDEFGAYVFRSEDYGSTWRSIGEGLPAEPVRVVAEDPEHPNLIYIGTDSGVYVSLDASGDGGAAWVSLTHGLPVVPVFDLAVHPREHELVIATHGRSMFVLDIRAIQDARQ